jgi:hypothetical protein
MKENNVRMPSVAGLFYPAGEKELENELREYFAFAEKEVSGDILNKARGAKILVVPHAGYAYSGPTAACGYWALEHVARKPKRIVLVGPSHQKYFKGAVVGVHSAWKTPLGRVPIGEKFSAGQWHSRGVRTEGDMFDAEHSLEVQIPFLRAVFKDLMLVPIMYSDIPSSELADIFEAVDDNDTVFVVSSDLSHYLPYREAQKIDGISNKLIRDMATEEAEDHLDACGKIGIIAGMRYAKKLGLSDVLVNYLNSGDTAGDKDAVVGYAAHLFYK